jgi:hypothetical protein
MDVEQLTSELLFVALLAVALWLRLDKRMPALRKRLCDALRPPPKSHRQPSDSPEPTESEPSVTSNADSFALNSQTS